MRIAEGRSVGGRGLTEGGNAMTSGALLKRMVRAIVEKVDPAQIIPFGSQARGGATSESDFDFIVVEAGLFRDGWGPPPEEARLYRAVVGYGIRKHISIHGRDEVDYWHDSLNHVLTRVLREGKVVLSATPSKWTHSSRQLSRIPPCT